ncbi:M28 family peptidase [Bacteroidota bacterium]
MKKLFLLLIVSSFQISSYSQLNSWYHWTFIPQYQMDEIIGEASGETAFNHVLEMGAYNKDRKVKEYNSTFYESEYALSKLKEYGIKNAEIVRFPGQQTWDGIKGELWEVSPIRQKLASYQDLRAMLASGSNNADVKAELVWVGDGSAKEMDGLDLNGKIVVTSASASMVHNNACIKKGAAGVISFNSPRPLIDDLSIPWSGIRGSGNENARFAFYLPPREGHILRDRLKRGEKIIVHAQVESELQVYKLQDVVFSIPGKTSDAHEIILCAHLFEGYTKQGANDNKSGSAVLIEVARTLNRLIMEGRIPQPKRGIRLLLAPEYSGTIPWVQANKDLMERTLCNINLDMVGLSLAKGQSYMTVMTTTYGHPHYINDVMFNVLRFVGETNKTIVNNGFTQQFPKRIVAPSGTEDPMYYYLGTHMGSSDHEVFNDWGVNVPGLNMNTWPDRWFHTSEDRPDKMDPTQLKRAVVIAASAAYTIANADDNTIRRMATEITSNASGRLNHQLDRGTEELVRSDEGNFEHIYKKVYGYIQAVGINQRATINSLIELASEQKAVSVFLDEKEKNISDFEKINIELINSYAQTRANELGIKFQSYSPNTSEENAKKIIPVPTKKIRENGYRGYQNAINEAIKKTQINYTDRNFRRAATEVQLLCDGKNSALDIKKLLDTENKFETKIEDIVAHLNILKEAGLVSFK